MIVEIRGTGEQSIFGDSPKHWIVDRIRDRLDSVVGGEWGDDPDAHDEGVLIPVLRVADIRGLDFDALYTSGVNIACIQQTTGIQNLRLRDCLSTKIAFPSIVEESQIRTFLDAHGRALARIVSSGPQQLDDQAAGGILNRQMSILLEYHKSLIHECVTGQRRITEADIKRVTAHG